MWFTMQSTMTPDEQEALSRRYSDDSIIILPLSSGRIAVFNRAFELCGFIDFDLLEIIRIWKAPAKKREVSLADLGLD